VSRYDWLLFLHVLAGFALIASMVIFATLLLTARTGARAPLLGLSWLGSRLWEVGGLGTLVFGLWLAIDSPPPIDYHFLDGWILAALVLWFVNGGSGSQVTAAYRSAREGDASALGTARLTSQTVVMTLAGLLLIVDMIFKPGS
jgi:uncharacterized membrane protein